MKQYQPQAPFNVPARHKPRTTIKVNGVKTARGPFILELV